MYVQILGESIGGSLLAGRGYVLSMDLQPPTPNNKSVKLENCKRVLRLYLKQITSVYVQYILIWLWIPYKLIRSTVLKHLQGYGAIFIRACNAADAAYFEFITPLNKTRNCGPKWAVNY